MMTEREVRRHNLALARKAMRECSPQDRRLVKQAFRYGPFGVMLSVVAEAAKIAMQHGNDAFVPLPNGGSIPVRIGQSL